MALQSDASFKSFFDDVTMPLIKTAPQYLAKQSKVLDFLYRPMEDSSGKPVSGISTRTGRFQKVEMDANYVMTSDKKDKYNIQFGETKVADKQRNVVYAEFEAVDKGFTMGITRKDLQNIRSAGTKSQLVDWVENYWKKEMNGFAASLTNSIYNGGGQSATRWDGLAKPDFDGLSSVIGTGTLGGKSTTDCGEWKSQMFDLTDSATLTKMGLVSTDIDTIDEFIAVPTGKKNTRFYDVINLVRKTIAQISREDEVFIIMNPATVNNLWLPSLEANSIGYASPFRAGGDNALEVKDGIMKIGNSTILTEDTRIPTTENGSSVEYVLPTNVIYVIAKSSLALEVEDSCNFIVTPWTPMQNQYGVMQKSLETTLLFYPKSRFNMAKITLPTAIKTALDARQFI
jgi:hypothetical protein